MFVRATDRSGHLGLEEVWAGMFPDNEPSAAVARRLGLREIGVRLDPWCGGDGRLFHTTREEWIDQRTGFQAGHREPWKRNRTVN
jgi:RimJ/RimL family protein N-acetyltransferase